jgi:geranylgeranyl pyrophosphate synthase
MAEWGLQLGLCFQLMDDLIDVTGDSKVLGKPACSDIVHGKRTLIALHALSSQAALPAFKRVFNCRDENIDPQLLQSALTDLRQSGSIQYAKEKAMQHHQAAHAELNKLKPNPAVELLRELTDFQLIRLA